MKSNGKCQMKRLARTCLLCVSISLLSLCMVPVEGSSLAPPDRAKQLRRYGYSTDTREQIIEASKSDNYFVRRIALELLVQRSKEGAIPALREALNDPKIEVRWRAASWLGTLGDDSGLKRMRQDLKELAPNNGAPVSSDPNVTDPDDIKELEGKRNLRLFNALTAAKVLAKLGDRRGYELAARMALEGPWILQRYEAVFALIEIAKTDQATLRVEGLDPVFVLKGVAESEEDENVIYLLANQVRENLRDDASLQILESAKNSTNLSDKSRRIVQRHIDEVKARQGLPRNNQH